MNDLQSYKNKLEELSALIGKLEKGELSVEELVTMETLTRELHERSIILKYKAFEGRAGVKPSNPEPTPEVIVEEPVAEEPAVEEEEESIDFSIFEESDSVEEEMVEESVAEPTPEPVVASEPEVQSEEHVTITEKLDEEDNVIEREVEVTQVSHSSSFLDKLNLQDNSLASQFSGGKIESLIGAFGLNQRLRFINNLFDGSSELFSDAVKLLDSQSSLDDAKEKALALANEHEWDPEEENVIEFMTYLSRRYA